MKATGRKIKELMISNGFSNERLAKTLNLSESAVKNYLYGRTLPPTETLLIMVKLFGLNQIEDILVMESEICKVKVN